MTFFATVIGNEMPSSLFDAVSLSEATNFCRLNCSNTVTDLQDLKPHHEKHKAASARPIDTLLQSAEKCNQQNSPGSGC